MEIAPTIANNQFDKAGNTPKWSCQLQEEAITLSPGHKVFSGG